MAGHVLYLVGGAPRVGKSSLAQRLLDIGGIPGLPTDVLRTVLRRSFPSWMPSIRIWSTRRCWPRSGYPHVEQAAGVCAEEADRFLIEGFELAPCSPGRLRAALATLRITTGAAFMTPTKIPANRTAGSAKCRPLSARCRERPVVCTPQRASRAGCS
jgi:hypothetical protein